MGSEGGVPVADEGAQGGDVGVDVGVVEVECGWGGAHDAVVAGFGDGQGDDGGGGGCDVGGEGGEVVAVVGGGDGVDDFVGVALGGAGDERVDAVLLGELGCGVGAAPGEGDDAPVVVGVLGVPGLVGAVECTESDMDDARVALGGEAGGVAA